MENEFEKLKKVFLLSWSLISSIILLCAFLFTGRYLYYYIGAQHKQPFAERTVQEFVQHYNNKDYDYIYNNLTDSEFKKISSQEDNKKELSTLNEICGKIVSFQKGHLKLSGDYYNYSIRMYQKTKENTYEMNYVFYFSKQIHDKNFKMYGYRYEYTPVGITSQYED